MDEHDKRKSEIETRMLDDETVPRISHQLEMNRVARMVLASLRERHHITLSALSDDQLFEGILNGLKHANRE